MPLGTSPSGRGRTRVSAGEARRGSSVLYQLMDERGTLQMPPIASLLVDTPDVAVVRAWIQAMAATQDGGPPDAGADASGADASGADASDAGDAGD